ncbi:segregation/condensation protein A, partial [Planktomarina sp.]|nr:segregation/condensation protein A [Planktomarina sp.]
QGYARIRTRDDFRPFVMDRDSVFTMEQALQRMQGLMGFLDHWTDILSYLPDGWTDDPKKRRSATASTFAASLELAKEGKIVIRQDEIFSPIQIKKADRDG